MSLESKISEVQAFFKKCSVQMGEKKVESGHVFYGGFNVEGEKDVCLLVRLILDDPGPWLRMIVAFPVLPGSEAHLSQISELLARVNFRLTFGRFEMNFDNGQIRFTSCQDLSVLENAHSADILGRQFFRAVAISERFYPYLKSVIHGDLSPLDANERFRGKAKVKS